MTLLLCVICASDMLLGKLTNKDSEIEALQSKITAMEEREAQRYEELRIEECEQRVRIVWVRLDAFLVFVQIESLAALLEEKTTEIAALRAENSSSTAASVVAQKELEYFVGDSSCYFSITLWS